MAKLSACKTCGKPLKPEEKHIHSSKTYCDVCYGKIIKDSDEYKQLIKYICDNYEIDRPTGLMLKQIKEYKEDYQYTYGGMTYTLWYVKEIISKEFITMYGVAIIKFYYDDAKQYFINQEEVKKSIELNAKAEIKTKVVKVNRTNVNVKSNSLIDLGSLLGGDIH